MRTTNNLAGWLANAREVLTPGSEQPGLEAQVLLARVLDKPRAWVLAHPEIPLNPDQQLALTDLLERLSSGVPLPYLTGEQEFYGLPFHVTPDVLIPRPETELLVERAIAWLKVHPRQRRVVDVGTGSGCIAVSLAYHVADAFIQAVDLSQPVLEIARTNALRHGVLDRIDFIQTNLLDALSGPFDLICANLPYIPSAALSSLPVSVYEPSLALDGGVDGLDLIRRLIDSAVQKTAAGGCQLYEIEYRQGCGAEEIARQAFPSAQIHVIQDLSGLDRLLEIQR